jgi:hypothetical protein
MNQSTMAIATALVLLAAAPAHAQEIRTLAPGAQPASAGIEALKGITGRWIAKEGETSFSAPVAGEIVGHVALTDAKGAPRVEELWIFRPEGGTIRLRQKIFEGDLTERQDKDKFLERRLVAVEGGKIYFENMTITPKGDTLETVVHRAPPLDDIVRLTYRRGK